MSQTFQRRTELIVKLVMAGVFLGFAASFATLIALAKPTTGEAIAQPIAFSHKHHVGDVGLDCRYCHTTVDQKPFAGMPSTHTCLTCHSQIFKDAPILSPLHDSARSGEPIAWKRLHRLPDFVYFDHSVHVGKGVACMECHGRVDQMPLTWRTASLEMQWCLACHRDPSPHLHALKDVYEMSSESVSELDQAKLAHFFKLESTRRLTDCSTCHR